ncbi:MAG: hypothetical protein ACRBI6_00750 [Acidimicrobiales bacterium]
MTPVVWLYRLLLRQQLTLGRVALVGAMTLLTIVAAVGIASSSDEALRMDDTTGFLWVFNIGLMVPIVSLVIASSSLGELVEDETLVYVWHRPTPRWVLALAAWAAAATVAVPATTLPTFVGGIIGSGDASVAIGGALAAALGTLAYSGVFLLLGLLVRRALIWGLVYVFVWEQFVARIGGTSARLSIGSYPSSVLAEITDIELPLAERGMTWGVIVPIALAALAVALTSRTLDRIDVA